MNTADMLIHVHPDLDEAARLSLERSISGRIGVDCAAFSHTPHSHALLVKYDPDTIQSMQVLEMVRKLDPDATSVSL
ncbi:MAG TPA: hypothetical protein VIU46_00205 [Gallionellaceae bacterium]